MISKIQLKNNRIEKKNLEGKKEKVKLIIRGLSYPSEPEPGTFCDYHDCARHIHSCVAFTKLVNVNNKMFSILLRSIRFLINNMN